MPRVFDFFLPPLLLLITWSAVTYDWPYRAQNLRSRLPGWFVTTHLPWVPVYAVILYAVWSLLMITWQVVTFKECPEAHEEIQQEIEMAKKDLKKRGLKF